ncbi:MAG: AbrB/MazE/SpoVT family DNA-binding domain-containing protein [Actinomycetota bacterium]
MRATIDKAGRLVIPKVLRDKLGLGPGSVELEAEGAGLRVCPIADDALGNEGRFLVIANVGKPLDDDQVRALRESDQR